MVVVLMGWVVWCMFWLIDWADAEPLCKITHQMEEWEAARMAQAVAVDVIDTSKIGQAKKTNNKAEVAAPSAAAASAAVDVKEEEEEVEEEYVPIDAMFRDELDVNTADGDSVCPPSLILMCIYVDHTRACCTVRPESLLAYLLAHSTPQYQHNQNRCGRTWCRPSWPRSSGGARSGPSSSSSPTTAGGACLPCLLAYINPSRPVQPNACRQSQHPLPPFSHIHRRSVQTRKLADHLAFLTNHVVLVPDLYRGDGWDPHSGAQALRDFRARVRCVRLRWVLGMWGIKVCARVLTYDSIDTHVCVCVCVNTAPGDPAAAGRQGRYGGTRAQLQRHQQRCVRTHNQHHDGKRMIRTTHLSYTTHPTRRRDRLRRGRGPSALGGGLGLHESGRRGGHLPRRPRRGPRGGGDAHAHAPGGGGREQRRGGGRLCVWGGG